MATLGTWFTTDRTVYVELEDQGRGLAYYVWHDGFHVASPTAEANLDAWLRKHKGIGFEDLTQA